MPAQLSLRAQTGLQARGPSSAERCHRRQLAATELRRPSSRALRRQAAFTTPRAAAGSEQGGYPRAHTAAVQDRKFERTPKEWIEGDRTQKCEAIKKLRLITAIKTPYLDSGKIDLYAYDKLVVAQIEAGVEGLIVGGTTGEGQLMSWDEHIMLIAHTANRFGSSIRVIGNTGSNATREAVHATCQGFAVGMDAALHINPYYGKTSRDGLIYHFNAVLDYGPTIVYNVPGRTGQDIGPDVVHELALHPNFAGMKECTGNERIKGYTQRGITCWSGNDDEAHDARYDAGAVGVISVTSNIVPGLMRSLMFDGPNAKLRDQLLPLMKWLFEQPNPIGLNTGLSMLSACKPVFRLPYSPYGRDLQEQGKKIMDALGAKNLVLGAAPRVLDSSEFKVLEHY